MNKVPCRTFEKSYTLHCKKKISHFPVPSWDVTYQTLHSRENLIIPGQGDFGDIPAGGRENR
jgi:hypothetical protein